LTVAGRVRRDARRTFVHMPDWSRVDKKHVLAAMSDYDRLGQREFLRRFAFGRARLYTVWHSGREYDSTAILGVAYLHATGTPPTSEDFSDGEAGAAKVLTDLGFDVAVDEQEAAAQQSTRKRSAPKPKKRPAARPLDVCPTCHMALPATGVCDNCG
jgi:hypothetical protein